LHPSAGLQQQQVVAVVGPAVVVEVVVVVVEVVVVAVVVVVGEPVAVVHDYVHDRLVVGEVPVAVVVVVGEGHRGVVHPEPPVHVPGIDLELYQVPTWCWLFFVFFFFSLGDYFNL
jgi:hypothetical protein